VAASCCVASCAAKLLDLVLLVGCLCARMLPVRLIAAKLERSSAPARIAGLLRIARLLLADSRPAGR